MTFEVTMEDRGNIVVGAYALSLFDGYGYMNYAAFVEADPISDQEILLEDVEVASGETLAFTAIFEVSEDAPLWLLMWQPDYAFYAMVDFTDEDV